MNFFARFNQWSFARKFFTTILVLILALGVYRNFFSKSSESSQRIMTKNDILHLDITGVIMNGKKFLSNLKKYRKDSNIKAIVIEINSPGGAVGPSQEIFYEIIRAKKEAKKPIICVSTGLMASGGYYAALACDKILVAPGAMVGSIGVIMEFANLEKLYDWAKVQRYTITSGKFKDSGSEYRAMREDERALFQDMINEVYEQFKNTVAESRNLEPSFVAQYADGRVMTGASAVKYKFADYEGTFEDAVRLAAKEAKLGDNYHVFKPKQTDKYWFVDFFSDEEEDDLNSETNLNSGSLINKITGQFSKNLIQNTFKTRLLNQPLMLMPGYWE